MCLVSRTRPRDVLVTRTLRGLRRQAGHGQAHPLRFKGLVMHVHDDAPRGLSLAGLVAECPETLVGLRAVELVALSVADLLPAIHADAGLVRVRRSMADAEGEGATA